MGRTEEGKSVTQHTDGACHNDPVPETIAITGCSTSEEMGNKRSKGHPCLIWETAGHRTGSECLLETKVTSSEVV